MESSQDAWTWSLTVALLAPGCPSCDRTWEARGRVGGKADLFSLGKWHLDSSSNVWFTLIGDEHPGFQDAGLITSTGDTSVSLLLLEQLSQI